MRKGKEEGVRFTVSHRRCSKCHARPEKKDDRHKLYLYKGFHLCETCFKTKGD